MTGRAVFKYFSLIGLAYVVATLGAGLADYLTRFDLGMRTNLLISSGIGLMTAMSLGAIDLAKQGRAKEGRAEQDRAEKRPQDASTPGPYPGPSGRYPSPPGPYASPPGRYPGPSGSYPGSAPHPGSASRSRTGGGIGLVVGAVVLLGLCAGGGYALTNGVQWASDTLSRVATPPWLNKTKDPGVERLAGQASKTSGPLTVTVSSVRVNDEATIVKINARNTGPDALTLPTFGNAQLTIPGATLQPDPAAGDWPNTVPSEGEATGTIVFDGVLAAGPAKITLSFSTIYGSLNAPRNIAVTFSVN
jgi:hypothetical protein